MMSRIFLLFGSLFVFVSGTAQEESSLVTPLKEDTTVHTWVAQMPVFDGCDPMDANAYTCTLKEMTKYLFSAIRYPQESMARNQGGITQVGAVIDKQGRIKTARIEESSGVAELDTEALRVIKAMPRWKPGVHNGQAVLVAMTIPVNFRPEAYRRE